MTFDLKMVKRAAAVCLTAFAWTCSAYAQDVAQMGTSDINSEAQALVNERKYIEARPYIVELIKRIKDSSDENLKKELEHLYYFEAYGYLQENSATPSEKLVQKAIAGFDRVIAEYPTGEYAGSAIRTKASCYDAIGDIEKATAAREQLLTRPYVDKLTKQEQTDIVRRMCETLYYSNKWDTGEKWFKVLLNLSRLPEDKVFAAAGLIQADIAKKDYDDAKKYFPYLVYDAPARSDISLNIAMLRAGDDLVKKEKFSDATLFYSMVLSRDAILENLKRYADVIRKKIDRITRINSDSPEIADLERKANYMESQIKAVENIPSYTSELMARAARNFMLTERDFESYWSYWQMTKLFPDHPNIADFYFATIVGAYKIGRLDDMFSLTEEFLKKFPDSEHIKDIKIQRAQYFLKKKDYPAFFAEAKKFVEENPDEPPYSGNFIFLMGKTWLDLKQYDELAKTFEAYAKKHPDTAISEGCMYWTGIAFLAKGDFKNASRVLKKLIDDYPNGMYSEDGMYRSGVAAFGAGQFEIARDTLESFIERYSSSQLRGEVEFFLGDIYANNSDVDKALLHYKAVEEYTKNQSFIDNSYTQAAKLLHNLERYRDEIALIDRYLEKFPQGICSMMSYQKARALELLGLPSDALAIYGNTIEKYGNNPLDDGVDKIILDYNRMYSENEVKLKATVEFLKKLTTDKQLLKEMVEVPAKRYRYFQSNPNIDKLLYEKFKRDRSFGTNLYKDLTIIKNLIDQYSLQIADYPKGGAEQVFKSMLQKAQSENKKTLAYRLMMGLDSIGKPLPDVKMFNADDIKIASVRTLVWMGKENEKYGPDAARKAFKEALDREEFEYLVDAIFGLAQLEERAATKGQGKWEDVIKLYTEVEEQFPTDARAADAVLKRADVYSKLGKRDVAVKNYERVLKSPAWRGESYAEALYRLGQIAQHEKKVDQALMYYDRCYLGYANCYKWTGKAVLAAAQLYAARSENDKAKEICNEFLENKLNEASPDFKEIKQFRQTL